MAKKRDETAVTEQGPLSDEQGASVSANTGGEEPTGTGVDGQLPTSELPNSEEQPSTAPTPPPEPPAPPTPPEPIRTVRALFLTNCSHNRDRYQAGQKEDLPEDIFNILFAAKAVRRLEG